MKNKNSTREKQKSVFEEKNENVLYITYFELSKNEKEKNHRNRGLNALTISLGNLRSQ